VNPREQGELARLDRGGCFCECSMHEVVAVMGDIWCSITRDHSNKYTRK